jgi:hypothetical protein
MFGDLVAATHDLEAAKSALREKEAELATARADILKPSFCGVHGHFKFQENGSSCLMCQREHRLVSIALAAQSRELERLRTEIHALLTIKT